MLFNFFVCFYRNCSLVFENGISRVPTREMYQSYLCAHLKILASLQNHLEKLDVLDNLMEVYKKADKLKFLTKEDYTAWVSSFPRIK